VPDTQSPAAVALTVLLVLVIPLAAAVGIALDARRRVATGEAIVWGLGCLFLFPLAFPLYLWRAYVSPARRPEPLAILPWVRALSYIVAALVVIAFGSVIVYFAVGLLSGGLAKTGGGAFELLCGALGSIPAIALAYAFRSVVDRRPALSVGTGFVAYRWVTESVLGLVLGLGAATLVALVPCLIGVATLEWHATLSVLPQVALLAPFLLVAAFWEEIAFRGYLQRNLTHSWGHYGAIPLSAALFAIVHGMNEGANALALANVLLIGVFLSLTLVRTDRLWLPTGFHLAWNFALGPLWGTALSGLELPSLASVRLDGPSWLTGGAFGPEGSVLTTAVATLLAAGAWLVVRRRSEFDDSETQAYRAARLAGREGSAGATPHSAQ